ncbi:hypothetical protein BDQ17DRAFT_1175317, partial [Cyathus striatus]
RPSQYAINKIWAQAYVEMDYFTRQGCIHTSEGSMSSTTDTLGITNENRKIALKVVVIINPLKNIQQDNQLTWGEISQARHTFLQTMEGVGMTIWSKEIVESFADFFTGLDEHPIREEEYGDEAVVEYQTWA